MNTLISTPDGITASLTGLVLAFGPTYDTAFETPAQPGWNSGFHYRSDNVAAAITIMTDQSTGDPVVDNYRPRTALGRELIALRRAHILAGGELLGWDEIDEEVRSRRGGIADA